MQVTTFPQEPAQKLLQSITKRLASCTVFVLGYAHKATTLNNTNSIPHKQENHHFTLLVLATKTAPGLGSNIANTIAEQTQNTITATILLHKPTDLATKQPHQIHFFNQALRFGHRLCLDKHNPPYLVANTIPPLNQEEDTAFWLKCQAVALFNIQAAKENPQQGVALCKIALLNTACTQIALGLIRVLMHYTPNEFGLKYLLELCNYCTLSDPNCHSRLVIDNERNPLSLNTKHLKMLCAPPSMLNHWSKLNTPEEDFQCILTATQDFLNQATNTITCHSRFVIPA